MPYVHEKMSDSNTSHAKKRPQEQAALPSGGETTPGAKGGPGGDPDPLTAYRQWLVDAEHKAYEAYDKALMTLAGGALAVSLTFVKDVVSSPKQGTLVFLASAWASLALSITAILVSIITGAYGFRRAVKQVDDGTVYTQHAGGAFSTATNLLNIFAAVAFVAGIGLLATFAVANMSVVGKAAP